MGSKWIDNYRVLHLRDSLRGIKKSGKRTLLVPLWEGSDEVPEHRRLAVASSSNPITVSLPTDYSTYSVSGEVIVSIRVLRSHGDRRAQPPIRPSACLFLRLP